MLQLNHVRKSFGRIMAVDGLTLHVRPGEVLGLLGPNGAGKTTTICMAVGLLRPDAGEVALVTPDGRRHAPADPHVRALIGLAPQSLALYDELTARENLAFFGRLQGLSGRRLKDRIEAVLGLTGLSDRGNGRARTYSGGMKRRLNLAAAIIHEPSLVLMDEPTAGVDPQSRIALFDIVRTLRDQGRTVVYSTHYMEEAEKLCDRVAIIDHGRLMALDTVPALIRDYGGHSVLRLMRGGREEIIEAADPVAALAEALRADSNGNSTAGPVESATIDRPTLENVFLRLTGRTLRD
jgi:ABC-2 type transport system ATP-binding protein